METGVTRLGGMDCLIWSSVEPLTLTRSAVPRCAGQLKLISIEMKRAAGHNKTHVSGLESFVISPDAVAQVQPPPPFTPHPTPPPLSRPHPIPIVPPSHPKPVPSHLNRISIVSNPSIMASQSHPTAIHPASPHIIPSSPHHPTAPHRTPHRTTLPLPHPPRPNPPHNTPPHPSHSTPSYPVSTSGTQGQAWLHHRRSKAARKQREGHGGASAGSLRKRGDTQSWRMLWGMRVVGHASQPTLPIGCHPAVACV